MSVDVSRFKKGEQVRFNAAFLTLQHPSNVRERSSQVFEVLWSFRAKDGKVWVDMESLPKVRKGGLKVHCVNERYLELVPLHQRR